MGRMHDTSHSVQAYIMMRIQHSSECKVQRKANSAMRERPSKNKKEKIYHYSESLFEHSLINKYMYNHVG